MKVHFTGAAAPRVKPIPHARHAEDGACRDGGWKPLSRTQKTRLSILARKASDMQHIDRQEFADWRHEVAIRACGKRISEASQCHWADLKAAFQAEAGQDGKALNTHIYAADNKRRVALHKLTKAMAEKGLNPSYAESICHTQFKVPLAEASAKQLWCLFFTIQNRKNQP